MPESTPEEQFFVMITPKPFLSSLISNPKLKFLVPGVILLSATVFFLYYFITSFPKDLKILAYVNNEPISEKFLKEKMAAGCLVQKSDNQSGALDKWVDFMVLKKGARELGIEASSSGKNTLDPKICLEENQQIFLRATLIQKLIPFRKVEYLIVDPGKEKQLNQLVKNYDPKKYNSLMGAAEEFIGKPKQATPSSAPSYTIVQRLLTFDMEKTGMYQNPLVFDTAFSLKTGEISKILPIQQGKNQNKLVLRIFQAGDNKKFASMDAWFKNIKSETKIVYFK